MRQLTMTKSGAVEWLEVAEPRIQEPRDAIVRPLAVSACDLDGMIVKGLTPLTGPIALGHEFVAEVVEPGDGATGLTVGDRVSVPFQISCGDCGRCRSGLTSDCETVPARSMYGFGALGGDWGGALSDLVRVPFADHMLVTLPAGLDPAAADSASDNLVDGWRTVGPLLEGREGAEVLVVGGGAVSIALYAVAFAVALGAARVTYLDEDEQRLALAAELGAEPMEGPPPHHVGQYDVTVDASADHAGLACALRSVVPGGVCTSVGIYWEPETPVPVFEMYDRGMTFVTGRPSARVSMPRVLELMAAGTVRPELITSKVVSFEDAPEALLETHTKLVMVPA
jgi:threonine dehydrogenase-like Zn-dependent dehydrogenase